MKGFATTEELIADLKAGKLVILVDDENRENEGDLVLAAEYVSASKINFMMKEGRGLICLSLPRSHIAQLELPLMTRTGQANVSKAAFTMSIDASANIQTGISAIDRAETIRIACSPKAQPSDVVVPGHIFPLSAEEGGVLVRPGHTEGSVDLAKLAGLTPAAVICEIIKDDGTMARGADLIAFAQKHEMKIGSIMDLIKFRLQKNQSTLITEDIWQEPSHRSQV